MEYLNTKILNYRLTRFIGEGGMASVYEGTHEKLGTKVAIKILNPVLTANKQIRQRFENEAKMMASLNHPNIVKVMDYDEQPDKLAIVMELLDGTNLASHIKTIDALKPEQAIPIFTHVLDAFIYAHGKGIIHRDIKPSNIFLDSENHVKILDFGIAKLLESGDDFTSTGAQLGTPTYMSPEQVKAEKNIDQRTDIYSLGVTLFFLLNGKPPYNSSTQSNFEIFNKIVYEPIPDLVKYPDLNQLIKIATDKDRNQRFNKVEEFKEEILKLTSNPFYLEDDKTLIDKHQIGGRNIKDSFEDDTLIDEYRKRGANLNAQKSSRVNGNKHPKSIKPENSITRNATHKSEKSNIEKQTNLSESKVGKIRRKYLLYVSSGIVLLLVAIFLISKFTGHGYRDSMFNYSMVFVPGSTFQMGSQDVSGDEIPVHKVGVSDFYIGAYEVTQAHWKEIMGENPSLYKSFLTNCDNYPVENVSWNDIQAFLKRVYQQTGKEYRLPTEAEWEYAAGGGATQSGKARKRWAGTSDEGFLSDYAWYHLNSDEKPHAVGSKLPNDLEIYDMTGNVAEWCSDWDGNYKSGYQIDPEGPSTGSSRVIRGGNWGMNATDIRITSRARIDPSDKDRYTGFRLVYREEKVAVDSVAAW